MENQIEQSEVQSIEADAAVLGIEALDPKAKLAEVIEKLNELVAAVNELKSKSKPIGTSVKAIESERAMTKDDAERILLGDLKDMTHKDAAEALGLSYGQIYSARKGFTFKTVYKEARLAAGE